MFYVKKLYIGNSYYNIHTGNKLVETPLNSTKFNHYSNILSMNLKLIRITNQKTIPVMKILI